MRRRKQFFANDMMGGGPAPPIPPAPRPRRVLAFQPCDTCCTCGIFDDRFDRQELGSQWESEDVDEDDEPDWHIYYTAPRGAAETNISESRVTWTSTPPQTFPRYILTFAFIDCVLGPCYNPLAGTYILWINGGAQRCELDWRRGELPPYGPPDYEQSYYLRLYDGDKCVGQIGRSPSTAYSAPELRICVDRDRDTIRCTVGQLGETDTNRQTLSLATSITSDAVSLSAGPGTSRMLVTRFRVSQSEEDVEDCDVCYTECRYVDGFAAGALSSDVWDLQSGTWDDVVVLVNDDTTRRVVAMRGTAGESSAARAMCLVDPPDGGLAFRLEAELRFQVTDGFETRLLFDNGAAYIRFRWNGYYFGSPDHAYIAISMVTASGATEPTIFTHRSNAAPMIGTIYRVVVVLQISDGRASFAVGPPDLDWDAYPWWTPWPDPGPVHTLPSPIGRPYVLPTGIEYTLIRPYSPASARVGFEIVSGQTTIANFRLARVSDELHQPGFACDSSVLGLQGADSLCEGKSLEIDVPEGTCLPISGTIVLDWCISKSDDTGGSEQNYGVIYGWEGGDTYDGSPHYWMAVAAIQHQIVGGVVYWRLFLQFTPASANYASSWASTAQPPSGNTLTLHVASGACYGAPATLSARFVGV